MSGDDRATPRPGADAGHSPSDEAHELAQTVESTALEDGSLPTAPVAASAREPGDRIDRYIVLDRLGAGGMGVVYAAYDPKLDRKVALKVLHGDPDAGRREASERLVAEARALARVTHPNVVAVHDVGVAGDEVYVGMELITGPTLKRWRAERPRVWRDVLAMFLEIGEGLAAVHDAGFVHRDVKPDNVLIDARGHARVTDFGLARPRTSAPRVLAEPERALVAESLAGPRADLTRHGVQMGTPAYMAPEQFEGGAVDAASDQFSYCVALWECLYGERPFEGDTFMSLMTAVTGGLRREPPKLPPSGLAVPRWLRDIVSRGLATDPRARWPSMRALLDALRAGDPRARLRRRLAVAAGVAFLLAAGGGTVLARAAAERDALARCDRAAEQLAWSEDDGAAIRAAFERSGAAEAATIAERVVASLDAAATRWRDGRRSVCVAHEVRGEQPPAIAAAAVSCFVGQRDTFEALVALLREGETAMVPRAAMAAEGLVSGDACSDPRELAKRPAPPDDPARRAEVARLERELNATLADEQVGTFERGLTTAEAALAAALATEHRPLLALARYRVAVFAEKLGQYERAAEQWRAAFDDAVMAGIDGLASSSAAALAHTEGYQLQRYDVGLRWAELAGIYHRRGGGGDGVIEARRLDVMAVMLEQKGELDAAIAMHERAIAMRRAAAGDKDHSVGYGLFNLSFALESKGRRDEAAARRREAMEIFEAHFGPNNPTTAHTYFALANLELDLGRIAAAEALYAKVLTVWRDTLGPDHPDVGDVHAALGDLREAQERPEEAVSARREALRIHRLAYASDHPNLAQSLRRLAQSLPPAARGEARELLAEAIAVATRKPTEGAEELGRALVGLGELQLDAGELGPAASSFERAIAAFGAVPRAPERWLARAELGLARALPAGARERAVALAQQAHARLGDDPSDPLRVAAQAIAQPAGASAGAAAAE